MSIESDVINRIAQQSNYDLQLFRQLPFPHQVEQVTDNLKDADFHISQKDKAAAVLVLNQAIRTLNSLLTEPAVENNHKANIEKMVTYCENKRDIVSQFTFTTPISEGDLS